MDFGQDPGQGFILGGGSGNPGVVHICNRGKPLLQPVGLPVLRFRVDPSLELVKTLIKLDMDRLSPGWVGETGVGAQ